ncbi:MAG: hypothetical protein KJ970_19625 [Candidatus Eisenbacteria bacterium]|uniref:Uncharacterized protein n=1 Tax=Eiseniibacteriota bacterium TaxID=2212470 RepID=A0A948S0L0_UNCEI|nr:hypothetical protein [Candidatus Eisenbacteria bacterium]MBU1948948.1 hypothetical protein [Candidatus Eisenbacteria bacterium]MBU2693133.1 hypothetical protein [Candidatus Eisenbacteria bacterium]
MRKLMLGMLILAAGLSGASAGPNEGVVLSIQGNTTGGPITEPCLTITLPESCENLDPSALPDDHDVEWFLVVVVSPAANAPNFDSITFGIGDYNTGDAYISYNGTCIPGAGWSFTGAWPLPGSGIEITWDPGCTSSDYLFPAFYFGVYVYAPATIPLTPHPSEPSGVTDCSEDSVFDPFEGFGAMGCGGEPGYNPPCPDIEPTPIKRTTWGNIRSIYR